MVERGVGQGQGKLAKHSLQKGRTSGENERPRPLGKAHNQGKRTNSGTSREVVIGEGSSLETGNTLSPPNGMREAGIPRKRARPKRQKLA